MKVGILTCHSCLNYGANLQLYASVKCLEKMGHDVFVFDNRPFEPSVMRDFVEDHAQLTHPCRMDNDFRQETLRLNLDVVLVGSDAVLWFLPGKTEGQGAYPNPFWLRWARDLPVRKAIIAGSSMGVMFPKLSRKTCSELNRDLSVLDFISVRDKWTLNFVRWIGIRKAKLTFDPTSILPHIFDPEARALPKGLESKKYFLFTFSNIEKADTWLKEFSVIAHEQGMKTCFISHPDRLRLVENVDICVSEVLAPLDWLLLLSNAAGYVGERFHPVVLSKFFSVPFISCDYYSKSGMPSIFNFRSKTRDFCKRTGEGSRLFPSDKFFKKVSPEHALNILAHRSEKKSTSMCDSYLSSLKQAIGENNK